MNGLGYGMEVSKQILPKLTDLCLVTFTPISIKVIIKIFQGNFQSTLPSKTTILHEKKQIDLHGLIMGNYVTK